MTLLNPEKERENEKLVYRIDSSMLSYLYDCEWKFYWRYNRNLLLSTHKSPALHFGDVFHSSVSFLYLTNWNIEKALQIAEERFDLSLEDSKRTLSRMKTILIEYFSNLDYIKDFYNFTLFADEIFISEKVYEDEDKILYYIGNIDKIFFYDSENRYIIMDHKTSTWNHIEDYVYELSGQFIGYVWLVQKHFRIPFKKLSFCLDMLFMQGKENKFFRKAFLYEEYKINEWIDGLVSLFNNVLLSENYNPSRHPSCSNFNNCPYFYLCNSSPETRGNIISAMYVEDKWNFLQTQKEKER